MASLTRAVGLAAPVLFGWLAGRAVAPWLPGFTSWVHSTGAWAPVVFVVAYAAGSLLLLPVFLLIMVGGAVFGATWGAALSMMGATIGGTLAFLIARHFAREQVARRVAKDRTLSAVDRVMEEDGVLLVFLLRLSPAVPFVLSNYALGITRVRLRDYVIGTSGLLPMMIAYAAYGAASGAGHPLGKLTLSPPMMIAGVLATIALGVWITHIVQRAIKDAERAKGFAPIDTLDSTERLA